MISTFVRMMKKVVTIGDCWVFTGHTNAQGYGTIGRGGPDRRHDYVHRVAYKEAVGPIPEGMEIDHLCKTRACVRPVHLEAVTHQVNQLRGDMCRRPDPSKCGSGKHDWIPDNIYLRPGGGKKCRECNREAGVRFRSKIPSEEIT